ncbi:MAG: hypothetical protein QOH48_931 [Actinomycetota bacterium]|nr:hypothetical protein [Actinomycetota bacterium]
MAITLQSASSLGLKEEGDADRRPPLDLNLSLGSGIGVGTAVDVGVTEVEWAHLFYRRWRR